MDENILEIEELEFDERLYQINIEENDFPEKDELDGKGEDNASNED